MRRSFESVRAVLAGALLLAACGGDADAPVAASAGENDAAASAEADISRSEPARAESADHAAAAVRPGLGGRTRELVNPDGDTLVLAYYDLAGLTPPFDAWMQNDSRISMARPIDKQAQREIVRAELEAAAAAARGVGALRISMHANLSDYDPSYGEFTVRALAPSSIVTFDGFKQQISLRFSNGLAAQTWRVPESEAQLIRDKVGPFQNAMLEVLVRITEVQPTPGGGGTLITEIVEYELRAEPSGDRLARIRVAAE